MRWQDYRVSLETVQREAPDACVAWDRDVAQEGWDPVWLLFPYLSIMTPRIEAREPGCTVLHTPLDTRPACRCRWWDGKAWPRFEAPR